MAGDTEARVKEGGDLVVAVAGVESPVDEHVQADVAFSPDHRWLAYSKLPDGDQTEGDLWLVHVPVDGPARRLTDWEGTEDRPVFSPDGKRLAFVSGHSGVASVYVLDVAAGALGGGATQLTNVGLERAQHVMGQAPAGFVPPPDGRWTWGDGGLRWVVHGRVYTVTP